MISAAEPAIWVGESRLTPSLDPETARRQVERVRDPGSVGAHYALILAAIGSEPAVAERACRPGHLTGSALVMDRSGDNLILLFHRKLQRWLQPGGHADGEMNLARVALREAREETGMEGLVVFGQPLDLDVHEVNPPAEDRHLHLDVRFLVVAPAGSMPIRNDESERVLWVPVDGLDAFDPDDGLVRLAERGRRLFSEVSGDLT